MKKFCYFPEKVCLGTLCLTLFLLAGCAAATSPEVHALLRDELHFDGGIMTEDLSMDALQQYTEDGSAAVLAVLAGNDMLVATDYTVQTPQVLSAVKDGTISTARLDDAVFHVLKWKQRLGLIEAQTA